MFSYMDRGNSERNEPFRFILNHTNAIAANLYLLLYPKGVIVQSSDILYKIWEILTNIAASNLEYEDRIYGSGLRKIEPKELACVRYPRLENCYDVLIKEKLRK